MNNIASLIDHTLLKPDATIIDIEQLCHEATQYQFHYSVCVNQFYVQPTVALLSRLVKPHGLGATRIDTSNGIKILQEATG